MSVKEAPR